MTHNVTSEQEKELTAKQRQAALLLAEGITAVDAAAKTGVSRVTVERWKNLPHFQAAVRQAEDDIYADALKLLKRTARDAIVTLVACMDHKVSHYVRVQAAAKLLEQAFEVHKVQPLEREVEELRQAIGLKELEDE